MADEEKTSIWSKAGMVIGGILLTVMSGGSLINSFSNDGSEGYEAMSPLIGGLIQDNARCSTDLAAMKTDIHWIKRELDLEDDSIEDFSEDEPSLAVVEALEELKRRIDRNDDKKADSKPKGDAAYGKPSRIHITSDGDDPFELPDFDAVQKAY
jgi:hypothetical protein